MQIPPPDRPAQPSDLLGPSGYPTYPAGQTRSHPVTAGPPYPAGWPGVPIRRRRSRAMPVVLSVGVVLLVLCGCLGVVVARPWYQRHQLTEAYEQLDFHVVGFLPQGQVIADHPFRLVERYRSDSDLVTDADQDFLERAPSSLYDWARNHGSTVPREDIGECFDRGCGLAWDYRGHHITIGMDADFTVETVPLWTLTLSLQPL